MGDAINHGHARAGSLAEDLLAVETAAARLEGAFAADPGLGRTWRAQMALSEACRSVGLEDVHVTEGELALRPFEARLTDLETARGTWLAEDLLRVIVAPGDLRADPEAALRRCLRAGPADSSADGADVDVAAVAPAVSAAIAAAPGPAMAAIRAAAHLHAATAGAQPSAERLLFLSTDHALRRARVGGDAVPETGPGADLILARMTAHWVLLPSVALTAQGVRAWSPASSRGIADLLAGLRVATGRSLGQVPVLRRWRETSRAACQGKHGKSRLADLVELVTDRPIVTTRAIAEGLGVTPRTALNLADEAVAGRILASITGRRTYRAWAPVPMAERLRRRRDHLTATGGRRSSRDLAAAADETRQETDPETAEAALADLDAAMAGADAILTRYRDRGE